MKRLLAGALVALVALWAPPAHADDAMNPRVLNITIIGSTKANPDQHALKTVQLPFETRYTCEEAADRLDLNLIEEAARLKLRKHANVTRVSAECEVAGPII